jgi:hypothetical protein
MLLKVGVTTGKGYYKHPRAGIAIHMPAGSWCPQKVSLVPERIGKYS